VQADADAHPTPRDGQPAAAQDRAALAEELVGEALDRLRQGGFEAAVQQRPRVARWLLKRFLPLVEQTLGPGLHAEPASAARMLTEWMVTQVRPDLSPRLDGIEPAAWLDEPAWRPMLALACHARLIAVPPFPSRYRPRAGEVAAEHLCGLWQVDISTFYRYLDRGKRRLARMALQREPLNVPQRQALRRYLCDRLIPAGASEAERHAWHKARADVVAREGHPVAALWHALQARDLPLATTLLRQQANALVGESEVDALIEHMAALAGGGGRTGFHLWMARAALARTRSLPERELTALERAVKSAADPAEPLLLGEAYAALGRYHEPRDADRAFASYADSAKYLLQADPRHEQPAAVALYMNTLVRLGWLYTVRGHPRSKITLELADQLRARHAVPDESVGMLEQCWGEYWRIAGDFPRAIEAKHRALNIFERIGDRRSVLATYINLVTLFGLAKDLERARAYAQRVFDAAGRSVVDPDIVVTAHGNLGFAFGLCERHDLSLREFKSALDFALRAGLRQQVHRSRFNLASALYRRRLQTGDPSFERLGDDQLDLLRAAPQGELTPVLIKEIELLKADVLGASPEKQINQLLAEESATHPREMAEIERLRAKLSGDAEASAQVEAHLAIARTYLAIADKERRRAAEIAQAQGLADRFGARLREVADAMTDQLAPADRLAAAWKPASADLLDDGRRERLLAHLLRAGAINKSGYAELCGVSPATASKHLATLAERGLLTQTGKGPSTRYLLPDPSARGSP
jgi:hypothetical protein